MTDHEARIERLREANDSVALQVFEDLNDQAKRAAANMLLLYGDKTCLSATGFIYCIQNAHEAALLHLLASGTVVLADGSRATDEEVAKRQAARAEADRHDPEKSVAFPQPRQVGAYL